MSFIRFRLAILGGFLLIAGSLSALSLHLFDRSQSAQIEADVRRDLALTRSVFNHLIERRGAQSRAGARLLASDYAFKRTMSKDPATIESSALNLRDRIGADAVWLVGENGALSADTTRGLRPGHKMTGMAVVKNALQGKPGSSIELLGAAAYQLAAVPINAPEPIGVLMVGFRIDDATAAELKRLMGTDVSLAAGGRLFASTVSGPSRGALEERLSAFPPGAVRPLDHGGGRDLLLAAPISKDVTAYLQSSLDDALEPLKRLKLFLILINLIGLGLTAVAGYLVTQRVTASIQKLNEELVQVNRFQTEFFSVVAHDVSNPLAAAKGYAQMLLALKQEPKERKYLEHLDKSLASLEFLISDLVDFASIEVGKLRIQLRPLDLAPVLAEIQTRMDVAAKKRGVALEVVWPETLPVIQGDAQRLAQVMQNLCSNAINYTPKGGRVRLVAEALPGELRLNVEDNGIGVAKEDLPKIFNRFFQAENARKHRGSGLGLGLKIAHQIVAAHGGRIEVTSDLGKGSTFRVTLPALPA